MSCNVIPEQRPLVKLSEKMRVAIIILLFDDIIFNVNSKKFNSSMLLKLYPAGNSFVSTENELWLSIYSN